MGASSIPSILAGGTLVWAVGLSLYCADRLINKVACFKHPHSTLTREKLPQSTGCHLSNKVRHRPPPPAANDLISTDHSSNNIPHCKRAICRNISLQTWGIAWFEHDHVPASQLSPLRNMHLPHSCKLNVAERYL